jgi:hypothetical protein
LQLPLPIGDRTELAIERCVADSILVTLEENRR